MLDAKFEALDAQNEALETRLVVVGIFVGIV